MAKFLLLFSIAFFIIYFMACKNEATKFPSASNTFDSVLYTINNTNTVISLDSVLRQKFVRFCDLRFSEFGDTLRIRFMLADTLNTEEYNWPKTNRFLVLHDKRIKVMSDEDFVLQARTNHKDVIYDPHEISIFLTVPNYHIIHISEWPPR